MATEQARRAAGAVINMSSQPRSQAWHSRCVAEVIDREANLSVLLRIARLAAAGEVKRAESIAKLYFAGQPQTEAPK